MPIAENMISNVTSYEIYNSQHLIHLTGPCGSTSSALFNAHSLFCSVSSDYNAS